MPLHAETGQAKTGQAETVQAVGSNPAAADPLGAALTEAFNAVCVAGQFQRTTVENILAAQGGREIPVDSVKALPPVNPARARSEAKAWELTVRGVPVQFVDAREEGDGGPFDLCWMVQSALPAPAVRAALGARYGTALSLTSERPSAPYRVQFAAMLPRLSQTEIHLQAALPDSGPVLLELFRAEDW